MFRDFDFGYTLAMNERLRNVEVRYSMDICLPGLSSSTDSVQPLHKSIGARFDNNLLLITAALLSLATSIKPVPWL